MIGTWIGSLFFFLPLAAQSATVTDMLQVLHRSPTGHEIATKLELLMASKNPEQRVEIALPDQLSESEKKICKDEPLIQAATLVGSPSRIFFCKSNGFFRDTIALGHEGVHVVTQVLDPQGRALFQLYEQLRQQYNRDVRLYPKSRMESQRAFAVGFERIKSIVNEAVAYQAQTQIMEELGKEFIEVRDLIGDMFSLAPMNYPEDREALLINYIPPEKYADVIYAYDSLEQLPWVLNHLQHYVNSFDLDEMMNLIRDWAEESVEQ